jgi:colanic acid/amylovoran biosynthesis glycosyltransferase
LVPRPHNSEVRLAFLTSQYPAASHTFIRREVEALRELGWSIDTFSVRRPGADEAVSRADKAEADGTFYLLKQSVGAFLAADAATLFSRPGRYLMTLRLALDHRAPGARGLFLGLAHFAEAVLLARELKRRRTTHLHNHFANSAATVGLLASRLLGIRWSFTMHGISETDYPAGLMLGRKIEAAEFVACVSWFGRAQGMRLVSADQWHKMHVIRCGLPFDRIPPKGPAEGNRRTIICVGRLSPEKGQAGLLQSFEILRPRHPELRLRLVGDGPERASLEALAKELGLLDAVTFTGRLPEEDTLAEIAGSDLLVLPSFMEGLPIVLMEAMAAGVPVIASRVAGIPELVEDDKTGLLFTPSNWDELASRIDCLLGDEALRTRLAEQAKEKIASEFDTRTSAERLARLFSATNEASE